METSNFIGSLMWPLMIAMGLGLLINPQLFEKMIKDFYKESLAFYVSGLVFFVVGLVLIYYHNIWELSWALIITILSWIIFIKSAFIIIYPKVFESLMKIMKISKTYIMFAGWFYVFLWLVICYYSFL